MNKKQNLVIFTGRDENICSKNRKQIPFSTKVLLLFGKRSYKSVVPSKIVFTLYKLNKFDNFFVKYSLQLR
jgi:hypothetical protein